MIHERTKSSGNNTSQRVKQPSGSEAKKVSKYSEFCRLRDYRKPGAEVPQYTEAEAFALATSKSKACNPAITKAASNE